MRHSFKSWHSWIPSWVCAFVLSGLLVACGGSGTGGGSGVLGLSLTDAPACGFEAVHVTVNKIRVHQSSAASDADSGWTDLLVNRRINLLDLQNGLLDRLGELPLPAGHYTQLRLVLDPNTNLTLANAVLPAGGMETALVTPSAVQSGLKLVHAFDVVEGQRVDLVLDVDACKSIVKRGNGVYALKPVISVLPFAINGIQGYVDTAMLTQDVLVTAQQNGEVIKSTAPNTATGEFFLTRLPVGNYDVVITAHGRNTVVVSSVPVSSSTSVTGLGSSTDRISSPTSLTSSVNGNVTLNPPDTTVESFVAARQTFGASPTVTIKSVTTLLSGAYSLSLPRGAPMYSAYVPSWSTSLLTTQPNVGATYDLMAAASTYLTQSVTTDISSDVTLDFTLALGP